MRAALRGGAYKLKTRKDISARGVIKECLGASVFSGREESGMIDAVLEGLEGVLRGYSYRQRRYNITLAVLADPSVGFDQFSARRAIDVSRPFVTTLGEREAVAGCEDRVGKRDNEEGRTVQPPK